MVLATAGALVVPGPPPGPQAMKLQATQTKVNGAETLVSPLEVEETPLALQRLGMLPKKTVWTEFGALAASLPAVCNLGQGYPDWEPPKFAVDAAREVCKGEAAMHQYARSAGLPALCEVLARRYSNHFGRDVDAMSEVSVCVGATQALLVALMALIQREGDHVVVLEPCFDLYLGQIRLAGGEPIACPMEFHENTFHINFDLLRETVQTARVLIVNSPQNPTGKVFSRDELEAIADIVNEENQQRHRRGEPKLYVISDEVYKYIVLDDDADHVHFSKFDGMDDVTFTVSSAGKTFSATGWQIGWIIGSPDLIAHTHRLLPYLQFCASTPMQAALAVALDQADEPYLGHPSYYAWLRDEYSRKRTILLSGLDDADLRPLNTAGGFFVLADVASYIDVIPDRFFYPSPARPAPVTPDWAFCRWLAEDFGVVAIPASPFFHDDDKPIASRLVRFAFCKSDALLSEAASRLRTLASLRRCPHPDDGRRDDGRRDDGRRDDLLHTSLAS